MAGVPSSSHGASSGSGAVLAQVVNTAGGNTSTTSATQADVDATNAVISFTAPASGNVLVMVNVIGGVNAAAQNCFLGLREATTNVAGPDDVMQGLPAASHDELICKYFYLTGIAGGSHTYKLAYSVNGGASFTLRATAGIPMLLVVFQV